MTWKRAVAWLCVTAALAIVALAATGCDRSNEFCPWPHLRCTDW